MPSRAMARDFAALAMPSWNAAAQGIPIDPIRSICLHWARAYYYLGRLDCPDRKEKRLAIAHHYIDCAIKLQRQAAIGASNPEAFDA